MTTVACEACNAFVGECRMPDPATGCPVSVCWICAHHVTEHDASLATASSTECECHPYEIYPADTEPGARYRRDHPDPEIVARHLAESRVRRQANERADRARQQADARAVRDARILQLAKGAALIHRRADPYLSTLQRYPRAKRITGGN